MPGDWIWGAWWHCAEFCNVISVQEKCFISDAPWHPTQRSFHPRGVVTSVTLVHCLVWISVAIVPTNKQKWFINHCKTQLCFHHSSSPYVSDSVEVPLLCLLFEFTLGLWAVNGLCVSKWFSAWHVLINAPPSDWQLPCLPRHYDFVFIFNPFSSVCNIDVPYSKDDVFMLIYHSQHH